MRPFFLLAAILMLQFVGTLTAAPTNPLVFYVATNGNDATARPGNPSLPYKTLCAFNGSSYSGLLMTAPAGSIIYIGQGTYYAPLLPIQTNNISLIGAGQALTFLVRSNWSRTNETDMATFGPFLRPNSGMTLKELSIIATNTYSSNTEDCAFGFYDDATKMYRNPLFANFIATNYVCENCTFYGDWCAYKSITIELGGETNSGTFINCIFMAGYNAVYTGPDDVTSAQNSTAINCSYFALCNLSHTYKNSLDINGVNQGQACAIHSYNLWAGGWTDIGGTCTVYFTNQTSALHNTFVYNEGIPATLEGTRFIWATNQTIFTYPLITRNPSRGWFFDTNPTPNMVFCSPGQFASCNFSNGFTTGNTAPIDQSQGAQTGGTNNLGYDAFAWLACTNATITNWSGTNSPGAVSVAIGTNLSLTTSGSLYPVAAGGAFTSSNGLYWYWMHN